MVFHLPSEAPKVVWRAPSHPTPSAVPSHQTQRKLPRSIQPQLQWQVLHLTQGASHTHHKSIFNIRPLTTHTPARQLLRWVARCSPNIRGPTCGTVEVPLARSCHASNKTRTPAPQPGCEIRPGHADAGRHGVQWAAAESNNRRVLRPRVVDRTKIFTIVWATRSCQRDVGFGQAARVDSTPPDRAFPPGASRGKALAAVRRARVVYGCLRSRPHVPLEAENLHRTANLTHTQTLPRPRLRSHKEAGPNASWPYGINERCLRADGLQPRAAVWGGGGEGFECADVI